MIQLCTLYINDQRYAIASKDVLEITRGLSIAPVKKGPPAVYGLINLRGQIITAINPHVVLGVERAEDARDFNVIISRNEHRYSLIVDRIDDVIECDEATFEALPPTVEEYLRPFLIGAYKLDGELLLQLHLENIIASQAEAAVAISGQKA